MPRERPEGAAGTTKPTQEVGSSSQEPEGAGTTKPEGSQL